MRLNYRLVFGLFVLSILVTLPALSHASGTAVVWTDKGEYYPFETVIIFGSGFNPSGEITISVTRPDSSIDEWAITSDLSGSFTTNYPLNGIEGVYVVVATDGTNTASTEFIDAYGIAWVKSSGSTYPPEIDTFLTTENVYATIQTSGGTGSKEVRIYVTLNDAWTGGVPMTDVSGGYETITLTASTNPQTHGPYLVWSAPTTAGSYDIVVDWNMNGIRDPGEKVDNSDTPPGFTVTPPQVVPEFSFATPLATSIGTILLIAAQKILKKKRD